MRPRYPFGPPAFKRSVRMESDYFPAAFPVWQGEKLISSFVGTGRSGL